MLLQADLRRWFIGAFSWLSNIGFTSRVLGLRKDQTSVTSPKEISREIFFLYVLALPENSTLVPVKRPR